MKINIFSAAPWVDTGYGRNCRDLVEIVREEHEVAVTTFFGLQGGSIMWGDVEVNPVYAPPHIPECSKWVKRWFEKTESDLMLQHFDIWVMPSRWIKQTGLPVVTYTPVDSYPLSDIIQLGCDGALLNVAMSRFAEHGFEANGMPTKYIPHWYRKELFFPQDKAASRKLMPLPEDKFIFGIVGTNKGPRKNIPTSMLAFKNALARNKEMRENCLLYIHTNMFHDWSNPEGYRLLDLVEDFELTPWIRYTDRDSYIEGLPDEVMRTMYNCFDVLLQPSMGEGFGIPIIEAQACGVPVIVGDNSAASEVCGLGGWGVPVSEYLCNQKTNSWFAVPSSEVLADRIITAYKEAKNKRELALENVKQYEYENVKRMWLELLREEHL